MLDGVHFNTISHGDNNMLVGYFDEAEIKEAIWDCGSSKRNVRLIFCFILLKDIFLLGEKMI